MIAEKDVMDMRRCVIVGGAEIRTYDRVRQYFRPDDFFIYCDCGLRHQKALGAEPDLIVGDFDSHEKPETDRETIVLPVKKDDTDTVFAAKEAMRRGFDEFLLDRRFRRTAGSYAGEYLPAGDAAGTGKTGPAGG